MARTYMISALDTTNITGSVRRDIRMSSLFHCPFAVLVTFLRFQRELTMRSTARTTAKTVRSRVRPAYLTVRVLHSSVALWCVMISAKLLVCFDWSRRRLSQAEMKVDIHLERLLVGSVSVHLIISGVFLEVYGP